MNMTFLKVRIVRIWDTDRYPGWAECSMCDAYGKEHRFQDKIPIFSTRDITSGSLPCDGMIRCVPCGELGGMVKIDTELPDRVESTTGQHLFYVLPNQLTNCEEDFSWPTQF